MFPHLLHQLPRGIDIIMVLATTMSRMARFYFTPAIDMNLSSTLRMVYQMKWAGVMSSFFANKATIKLPLHQITFCSGVNSWTACSVGTRHCPKSKLQHIFIILHSAAPLKRRISPYFLMFEGLMHDPETLDCSYGQVSGSLVSRMGGYKANFAASVDV
jgi:hypothetical protein